MLQCLLTGEIPLFYYTTNNDALKRRFPMFPKTYFRQASFAKALKSRVKFTIHCTIHYSLLLFMVLFTPNFCLFKGGRPLSLGHN